MMMQGSFMLRNTYQKGDFTNEAAALRSDFIHRTVQSLQVSQEIFEKADRSVWRCDPELHLENSTYLQITKLLEGHIENEMDLNRERTCTDTCQNYQFTEQFGCSEKSICNRQSKCQGKILSCTSLEDNMWICPGSKQTNRRYDFIVYDSGKVLGEAKPCPTRGFHVSLFGNISDSIVNNISGSSLRTTGYITFSGVAIIVSAFAMSKVRNLIASSVSGLQYLIQETTCKKVLTNIFFEV